MILYFTQRYLIFALLGGLFLYLPVSLAGAENPALMSLVWAGFISGYLTYLLFRKRNLWVLCYNLRIPQYLLIGAHILLFELLLIVTFVLFFSKGGTA